MAPAASTEDAEYGQRKSTRSQQQVSVGTRQSSLGPSLVLLLRPLTGVEDGLNRGVGTRHKKEGSHNEDDWVWEGVSGSQTAPRQEANGSAHGC